MRGTHTHVCVCVWIKASEAYPEPTEHLVDKKLDFVFREMTSHLWQVSKHVRHHKVAEKRKKKKKRSFWRSFSKWEGGNLIRNWQWSCLPAHKFAHFIKEVSVRLCNIYVNFLFPSVHSKVRWGCFVWGLFSSLFFCLCAKYLQLIGKDVMFVKKCINNIYIYFFSFRHIF